MKGLIVNAMASSRVVEADGRGEGGQEEGGRGPHQEGTHDGHAVSLESAAALCLFFLVYCEPARSAQRSDAREIPRKNLRSSHVCWHVYGLLHRSCQDYSEAIKAYKQALRIDPENLQILRDLGLLQVQMRDLAGFRETRLAILTLRPNSKVHWLTYALAVHVGGDPAGAVDVIDSYTDTLDEDTAPEFQRNFESSELVMYKNRAMGEAAGDDEAGLRGALENLDRIEPVAVDRTGWLLARVDYQLRLRMYDEAAGSCLMLFERGITEDHRIHGAYMCALLRSDAETVAAVSRMKGTGTLATLAPLDDGQRTTLLGAYERPPACLARSPAVRRIVLTLLDPSGPAFRAALDGYARRQLGRGVPSLGSDLSSLYLDEVRGDGTSRYVLATDPADVRAHGVHRLLAGLVDSYVSSLEGGGSFPRGSGGGEGGEEEEEEEAGPGALLWSWYLRAVLHEQAGE
ncbi:hypothetical protein THAOC_11719 [Thalassiosira oceanica]|uniref:Uncharacterized protein n=1 Tax=Thalassiosira oceanica TaxID=159749 RepID=K0SPP2_THAOC|nr:hypothetical protein THAOC_11719 [Thalassiosira oceanica]|eukprot:EJK67275.1 hypothetical protein THAOC_11719 [Thalassiosira oceanica]